MKRWLILSAVLLCLAALAAAAMIARPTQAEPQETIVITMLDNGFIRNIDSNYYKLWLEEQIGVKLQFNLVPQSYSDHYLESVFSTGAVKTDILFLPNGRGNSLLTQEQLMRLGEKGTILPLNDYIPDSHALKAILTDFTEYDLLSAMSTPEGELYYIPSLDLSRSARVGQVLWLNTDWLSALDLTIPTTTEEFEAMLLAFASGDPNGNGLADEVPLAGSRDLWSQQSHNFLINAFVYSDPEEGRLFVQQGSIRFAPVTDQWRDAMIYLNDLYRQGLLSPLSFSMGSAQLSLLANDPGNVLGAFTAESISDVLLETSQDVLSKFTHVPPLIGPTGTQNATERTPLPIPGAAILSSCENPDTAFALLDLMLSEEAFLIARYGQQGLDWEPALGTDMDLYGERATLRVLRPLRNTMQNQHFMGAGPGIAYPQYTDGATWLGYDAAYFNGRAYLAYEPFQPKIHMGPLLAALPKNLADTQQRLATYSNQWLEAFMTGRENPADESSWQRYIKGYEALGLSDFLNQLQTTYEEQETEKK